MEILKERVPFNEVLAHFEEEHTGWEGYKIGLIYLHDANQRWQGKWTLVLLSRADIASVMLPAHNHTIEVIPPSGSSVADAARRLKCLPKEQMQNCWQRICGINDRDFSQMHLALEFENGILKHVDGVHRLLAYEHFQKEEPVLAYVAGVVPSSEADLTREVEPATG